MAQEILNTFENELEELSLVRKNEPGCFRITSKDVTIWCRKKDRGFPQIKELKQEYATYLTKSHLVILTHGMDDGLER